MVWFSAFHSAELYAQAVGRLARTGQTEEVRVLRLIMEGTEDEAIWSDRVPGRLAEDAGFLAAMAA
jgi:hypothetical protein